VLDRLGLGWQALHRRNKRLILASISGFGQTGPYSTRGGFDLITQAMSGLMSTNGPSDGPPHRLPIAISDVTAGMFLAFGVLAAVEARHRTGEGQHVETSLLEAATSLAVYESAHYFRPGRGRSASGRRIAAVRHTSASRRRTAISPWAHRSRNSSGSFASLSARRTCYPIHGSRPMPIA